MKLQYLKLIGIIFFLIMMSGCVPYGTSQSIVNSHAEAMLTKKNELQFRFKINGKIINNEKLYKVKVTIHNQKLATALGVEEIVYGSNVSHEGAYIEAKNQDHYIFIDPIPLLKDLHVFEIEDMIMNGEAVSIEVFNEDEIIAKAFLTNFSSQL